MNVNETFTQKCFHCRPQADNKCQKVAILCQGSVQQNSTSVQSMDETLAGGQVSRPSTLDLEHNQRDREATHKGTSKRSERQTCGDFWKYSMMVTS
jgi:hypothetical protein